MPPKSKKEQEEQAARLAEEQRKRQEEEARLAEERKKYAGETIGSGLYLPASTQLFHDFPVTSLEIIKAKLTQNLTECSPNLAAPRLQFVLKQILFAMKDGREMFGENEEGIRKSRVYVGIVQKIVEAQRSKQQDERILKDCLKAHSAGTHKVFSANDAVAVLGKLKQSYFGHHLLLSLHSSFPKRTSTLTSSISICSPTVFLNHKETPWIDLSKKVEQSQKGDEKPVI